MRAFGVILAVVQVLFGDFSNMTPSAIKGISKRMQWAFYL